MVPNTFTNFFIASTGAGAALLGLLFVSISISPEEKITADARIENRLSAYGALTLLINAFFISLAALIPSNLGTPATIISIISLIIALQNGITLLRPHENASALRDRLIITLANLFVYAVQGYCGILLLRDPGNPSSIYSLTTLLLIIYVLGIARAWSLLGGMRPTRRSQHPTDSIHSTPVDEHTSPTAS